MEGRSDRESTRLCPRTCQKAEEHRDRRGKHEDRDRLILPQPERIRGVPDPKEAEKKSPHRVMQRPDPEDHAVRPATDEATQPQGQSDSGQVPDHVVGHDEVDGPGRTGRVGVREADAEAFGRGAGGRVVLTVDDVADPADREPERYSRRRGIGSVADRHAAPDRRDVPTEHAADGRPPDRDAAGPDEEDLLGMRDVVGQLIDDVDEPCADDAADNAPRGDRPAVLLTDLSSQETEGQPHTKEDADRCENAVPRERDRPQMNIWIEWNLNHEARRGDAPRVAPASGLCARRGCPGDPPRVASGASDAGGGEGAASARPRAASPSGAPAPWDRTRGSSNAVTSRDTS